MGRLLFLLEQLFMVWMLVDAMQRRSQYYWYAIILLPFGEWFYFFFVKFKDPEFADIRQKFSLTRPPSIDQLRYKEKATPSVENRIILAQALYDRGLYTEAAQRFADLIEYDPDDVAAIYGLGLCKLANGDGDGAIALLESVIRVDPNHREYQPWIDLAQCHWEHGDKDRALAILAELARTKPRTSHSVAWATYLIKAGKIEEARAELKSTLDDFGHAPRYVKRSNHRWARAAKKLLRGLPTGTVAAAE